MINLLSFSRICYHELKSKIGLIQSEQVVNGRTQNQYMEGGRHLRMRIM